METDIQTEEEIAREITLLEEECSRLRSSISNCNLKLRNMGAAIKEYYHVNEITGDLGRYVGTDPGAYTLPEPKEITPQIARDPFKKQT